MTWSSFTLLVAVCYAAYYGLNVLMDLLRPSNAGPSDGTETLVLVEAHRPTVIADGVIGVPGDTTEADGAAKVPQGEEHPVVPSPLSGGVEYLDFIKLCRQKAILETSKHEFA